MKIAARWGEETERLAWKTRTEQYLYLLSINELSDNKEAKNVTLFQFQRPYLIPQLKLMSLAAPTDLTAIYCSLRQRISAICYLE